MGGVERGSGGLELKVYETRDMLDGPLAAMMSMGGVWSVGNAKYGL